MKFTCKTSNLKEAINKIERIVSKQTTLPILGNILLSTENGRITVAATNLEIAIKSFVGGKIDEDGSITVPARIISGFLNTIKDDVISAELLGSDLKINSTDHNLKIKGLDAKDFPIIPEIPDNQFFSLQFNDLANFLSGVLISVAHNDTRQELNGIFIKLEKEQLILASTDSFRLSEAKIPIKKDSITEEYLKYIENNNSLIIPALTLSEVLRIINEDEISFSIEQNQIFIQNKDTKIISRLINGSYPEYNQVLPKKFNTKVLVEKEKLINAIKIASLVSGNQNGEVYIKSDVAEKSLVITSQSIDTGNNVSKIDAEIDGPDFEVYFNCRYFLEGLNSSLVGKEKVQIKINQQNSPVILQNIKEGDEKKFIYVIMPIIKS